MRNIAFKPCIPTRGTKVPAGADWIHEIKHDGYRLIVVRDGARVRLLTRNGYDWADRYPLIVEAALKKRTTSFVIDGEAVLFGVDGISDFNALRSRRHDDEVRRHEGFPPRRARVQSGSERTIVGPPEAGEGSMTRAWNQ